MKAEGQNDHKKKQVYSNGFSFKISYGIEQFSCTKLKSRFEKEQTVKDFLKQSMKDKKDY